MSIMNLSRCLLLFVVAVVSSATATDWPQWRGPHHNGISDEKAWKSNWGGDAPKVLWNASIGIGFSSFSVANGRVFTTGHADKMDTVFCCDVATGKIIWKHSYTAELGDKYYEGGTSATPVVDGEKLFHLSKWGDVFCFHAASGKVIWSKNVQKETGAHIPDWGFAGSPLVHGQTLLLNVGGAGLALDKASGKILWQSTADDSGYSTPILMKRGADDIVLFSSGKSFVAVDPKSGKKAWEFEWTTRYGVNAADPIINGDRVFISSSYNKGCALLKVDSASPLVVWQNKELKNQLGSSVLLDGHLYGFDGDNKSSRSPLKCIEFATGTKKWEDNTVGPGALMIADGKLIVLTNKGELIIAKASPQKFDVISRAPVLTGTCWTVPVLANGRIYVRNSKGDVVCLDVSTK